MKATASIVSCALVAGFALTLPSRASAAQRGSAASGPASIEFNRNIRPILSDKCYACHGPDKNARKAKLRLDLQESALADRDGHAAIVPGKPQQSKLVRRINSTDEDEVMPPPKHPKRLTPLEKKLLERWIAQGAKWQGHWAYLPLARPAVPKVKTASWPRNPIDNFILARLESEKLKPSPEANRRTLIRRLSFDLTGLPPGPEEVELFVADKDPKASESLVERLLRSPHYGERMAVFWLDLVRFADTIGYHSDNVRNIHPYRDYVINAFNDNLPFDRFTIEQLAGDLLPNATLSQKVASGYNRLLQTTEEGGAQPKEYEAIYFADRVRNFSSVWLASTMGCAQCHDHKFDPFTMKDFYSLAAFFADVKEAPTGRREDGMMVPDTAQQRELVQLEMKIAGLKQRLSTPTLELAAAQAGWEKSYDLARHQDWHPLELVSAKATGETKLEPQPDGSLLATGKGQAGDTYTVTFKTAPNNLTGIRLELLPDSSLPKAGPGRADDGNLVLTDFTLTVRSGEKSKPEKVELLEPTASYAPQATGDPVRVWQAASVAEERKGKFSFTLAQPPQFGHANQLVFPLKTALAASGETLLTFAIRHDPKARPNATLGRFRISATAATALKALVGLGPEDIATIIAEEPARRTESHRRLLETHYRAIAPLLEPVRSELADHERRQMALLAAIPRTLISMSGPAVEVRVKARGNWMDDSGEVVGPAVPRAMNPLPARSERATRLDLARWLVAPENPLTARVFVNRLWKLYFGEGLSKTLEDLGSQGEWPTHPELIDWLAVELRESGWDVKHIIKLMVNSAAYRQTSVAGKQLKERDPYNRLLGRQARFRLDAEFVRDHALAVSGLLAKKVGGPSAKPYQPEGYWQYLNFPTRTYPQDHSENLYRRSLYTHWQRSFLHPSLLTFDAPSREECVAERARSNTPQQALVLLNDPIYVEAARVFAEHVARQGGTAIESRVKWAFTRVLSRPPNQAEATALSKLYHSQLARYQQDKDAAQKLLGVGEWPVPKDLDPAEVASWTAVARALFSLHETVNRM